MQMFRPQDRVLYAGIGAYSLVVLVVMGASYGSFAFIDAGKAFGLYIPVLLILSLIGIQICRKPRFSPVAFVASMLAVLIVAFIALMFAGAASAAV
jgi:hypothetical protein